jgi:hypothetical protein
MKEMKGMKEMKEMKNAEGIASETKTKWQFATAK